MIDKDNKDIYCMNSCTNNISQIKICKEQTK